MRTWQPDGSAVELVDGVRRRWHGSLLVEERALTPEEAAGLAASEAVAGNAAAVRDQLHTALTSNSAYLANDAPTQAEVLTQVRRLTRQANGLIRHVQADLDDIADTGDGGR